MPASSTPTLSPTSTFRGIVDPFSDLFKQLPIIHLFDMSKITPQSSSARSNGTKKLSFSAMVGLTVMLLNALVPVVSARSGIKSGQVIPTNESLESPDQSHRLLMKENGSAVLSTTSRPQFPIWILGKESTPANYRFKLRRNGRACVLKPNGRNHECTSGPFGGPRRDKWSLDLHNNGVLYLKDSKDQLSWTSVCPVAGTILKAGEQLKASCLVSPDQNTFLYMRPTGPLVIYKGNNGGRDFEHADGSTDAYFMITHEGALKIIDPSGNKEYYLYEGGLPHDDYTAEISNDQKIVIRGSDGNPVLYA